ncbi:MAG: hypothetical protein CM1200mP38_3460 [Dehalococcoidia bacterium]|nr:MAG: hypothetical protein CM1200mP38_3460 [Dehalococcoidia bacterium]
MRTLGIDFGEKRIGLAISDPLGILATPIETLDFFRNGFRNFPKLAETISDHVLRKLLLAFLGLCLVNLVLKLRRLLNLFL